MAHLVQQFLRQYSIADLENKFSIITRRHGKYPNLVLFKYNQIESPMGNPMVQQCRGLILDEDNNWAVVSYPYDKFFRDDQGHAAEIDWSTARAYTKLDGSLMIVYYYQGKWHVSSSGVPDASGIVMGTETTFAQLFWGTWDKLGYDFPNDKNKCYMFELIGPMNRIVVVHKEANIILHGARDLKTMKECNPVAVAYENGWQCVKLHPLTSFEEVKKASKDLSPTEPSGEGYVVCDANYNRLKVKNPAYDALSHLKSSLSTRSLLEMARRNSNTGFLSAFPGYADLYYKIRIKYERFLGEMEGFYDAIKDIEHNKDFAAKATTKKYSGALFAMRHGKVSELKEFLAEMQIKHLEDWLEIKWIDLSGSYSIEK